MLLLQVSDEALSPPLFFSLLHFSFRFVGFLALCVVATDSSRPSRRSVVACAGVCRNWRQITKEIVKVPELSGFLTFPISVKQGEDVGGLDIATLKEL